MSPTFTFFACSFVMETAVGLVDGGKGVIGARGIAGRDVHRRDRAADLRRDLLRVRVLRQLLNVGLLVLNGLLRRLHIKCRRVALIDLKELVLQRSLCRLHSCCVIRCFSKIGNLFCLVVYSIFRVFYVDLQTLNRRFQRVIPAAEGFRVAVRLIIGLPRLCICQLRLVFCKLSLQVRNLLVVAFQARIGLLQSLGSCSCRRLVFLLPRTNQLINQKVDVLIICLHDIRAGTGNLLQKQIISFILCNQFCVSSVRAVVPFQNRINLILRIFHSLFQRFACFASTGYMRAHIFQRLFRCFHCCFQRSQRRFQRRDFAGNLGIFFVVLRVGQLLLGSFAFLG